MENSEGVLRSCADERLSGQGLIEYRTTAMDSKAVKLAIVTTSMTGEHDEVSRCQPMSVCVGPHGGEGTGMSTFYDLKKSFEPPLLKNEVEELTDLMSPRVVNAWTATHGVGLDGG